MVNTALALVQLGNDGRIAGSGSRAVEARSRCRLVDATFVEVLEADNVPPKDEHAQVSGITTPKRRVKAIARAPGAVEKLGPVDTGADGLNGVQQ